MDSLRGQLLIASPAVHDPNFRRTVVLIAEHNEAGAMGVILNRPAEVTVAGAVPELEELAAAYESELPDAIAAYWRMRDTKTVPPTPQETRELQEIRTQQDALAEVLSATFAWARPGENILPVYLSIQRPARMNDANWGDVRQIRLKNPGWDLEAKNLKELRAELEDLGYDGIVYENRVEDVGSTSWIAFRPEQIKSATGNRGTFSPDDPRVNFNRSPR